MNRALPPHIIRRRRIAGLVIVGLLIWALWALVSFVIGLFSPGGAKATNVAACAPGVVSVTALSGDGTNHVSSYAQGERPLIWFTIVNNGKTACSFNTGAAVQFFRIRNSEQVVWDSKQCDRKDLGNQETVLKPGKPIKSPVGMWMRVYSSNSGCGEGQAPAMAGTYSLVAEVNGVVSSNYEEFNLEDLPVESQG